MPETQSPHQRDLVARDTAFLTKDFAEHQAVRQVGRLDDPHGAVTLIRWAKPGTGINAITYLLHKNVLYVSGDLGEAVYEWAAPVTLPFLAGCALDYFAGKCQASSQEPRGKRWDSEEVKQWIERQLQQWALDNPIVGEDGSETPRTPLSYEDCCSLTFCKDGHDLDAAVHSYYSWATFIRDSYGFIVSADKVDGECPARISFEPREDANVGWSWDLRTRAHWMGLQLAFAQLRSQGLQPGEEVSAWRRGGGGGVSIRTGASVVSRQEDGTYTIRFSDGYIQSGHSFDGAEE